MLGPKYGLKNCIRSRWVALIYFLWKKKTADSSAQRKGSVGNVWEIRTEWHFLWAFLNSCTLYNIHYNSSSKVQYLASKANEKIVKFPGNK